MEREHLVLPLSIDDGTLVDLCDLMNLFFTILFSSLGMDVQFIIDDICILLNIALHNNFPNLFCLFNLCDYMYMFLYNAMYIHVQIKIV